MRFEDFYSTTSKSKHIKNLHEGNIFQKVTPEAAILMAEVLHRKNKSIPKELEDIIAREPVHAVRYARRVLKGRFPQGEQAILNSAYDTQYISFLKSIGYEDLEESTTLQNMSPDDAYDKAVDLFNKKEPIPKELEDIIATDAQNALNYADYILKGRFLKGEPAISKNGMMALDYAMEVIGGRFPEGEEAISEDPELHDEYIEFLNSIGYEDLEESTSNNPYKNLSTDQAYDLAINLSSTNKPIPKELEEIIAKDPHNAYFYAKYVVKGRFPQGEPMIMSNLDAKANYIRFLNKIGYEDLEESFENFFNSNIRESNTPLTPKEAYEWALRFDRLGSKIPKEMEDVIAKDAKASLKYALHVKRARFEKGEPVIATDPEMSYNYAKHIIKGRFPEGEEVIMKSIQKDAYVEFLREINYSDVEESFENFFNSTINESFIPDDPEEAYELAKNYKYANKQIPEELENVLAESPKYSYMYAKYILGDKPFPKGEPVIIQSYTYALDYARKVLKGRFPLGEELLSKDPDFAYLYARDVIKGRFPEGEEAIMSLYHTKNDYIKFLKYIGYEDVEESAFTKDTLVSILDVVGELMHKNLPVPDKMINAIASDAFASHIYARDIIEKPFPEGEKAIAKDGYWSYYYAREVMHGRFPEGEEAIFRSMYKDDYLDYLREINYQDLEESFEHYFTESNVAPEQGVVKGFLNEASSDEAWELVGQPVPEIQQFVKQMGYGNDKQSVEKITQIIDSAKSSQIPFVDIPKLKNFANKGNDTQTLKAILKISDKPDAEQQYVKLMKARDASEGRERDITGYIQYVKSGNYDPPVLLKLPTGLYVVGGRTRLYAALALGVPATVKILSADNFKQGKVGWKGSLNHQDVEESFEQFFTEAKRKVRPPTEEELTDPYAAAEYAENVLKGRFPEGEPVIIKAGIVSIEYARDVIKGRWPEFENRLVNNPNDYDYDEEVGDVIMGYIGEIIQGRWPEIEPFIFSNDYLKREYTDYLKSMNYQDLEESFEQFFTEAKRKVRKPNKEERTNPLSAAIYASEVVQGRVPELEPLILTEPTAIAQYIWFAIKGRWKEAEETIANIKPSVTTLYALEILKDRWINIPDIPKEIALQAEENIKNSPGTAAYYATDIIKGRWPEGEASILSKPDSKEDYINFLKSINYQDVEESFELYFTEANVRPPTEIEKKDFVSGLFYAKNVLHGRWPELEQKLLNLGSAAVLSLYTYAKEVVKDRWPEAEPFIIDAGTVAPDYARDVIKGRWPELEKSLLENIDFYGEEIDEFTLEVIMYYIYEVVKGRWEEVEPYILQFDNLKKDYIDFLNELNYQDLEESHRSGKRLA